MSSELEEEEKADYLKILAKARSNRPVLLAPEKKVISMDFDEGPEPSEKQPNKWRSLDGFLKKVCTKEIDELSSEDLIDKVYKFKIGNSRPYLTFEPLIKITDKIVEDDDEDEGNSGYSSGSQT